jgi:hypothetical protein
MSAFNASRRTGSPHQLLDMYGSDVAWFALNSSYDKAFGTFLGRVSNMLPFRML